MKECSVRLVLSAGLLGTFACQPSREGPTPGSQHATTAPAAPPSAPAPSVEAVSYSVFGAYTPLPAWSGWCGLTADVAACAAPLAKAVQNQTSTSRPTVRGHGWHLWSSIWAPLSSAGGRNDALEQRTNLYGTGGCWLTFGDGSAACSGVYPLWLTWPNTGVPYRAPSAASSEPLDAIDASDADAPPATTIRTKRHARGLTATGGDPDPTKTSTVNTNGPTYVLPPLVLVKQCGITLQQAKTWLLEQRYSEIKKACKKAGAPGVFCSPAKGKPPALCDGTAFVNQGDVMIATESLSLEGYEDIQRNQLYDEDTLEKHYAKRAGDWVADAIGPKYISTKHMFWPVKGCKPGATVGGPGCRVRYGALPPWVPKDFRRVSYATNADYLGYEKWRSVVAIDTCKSSAPGAPCPPAVPSATLALAYVTGARPISTQNPPVYPAGDFIHVQISEEALKNQFTPTDRALLDQAMIWAYGDASQGFEAGDFLVVAAMHVNTKEIPSWTFQSVWWSPMNDALEDCPLSDYDHCFGQTGGYAATAAAGKADPNRYSGLTADQIRAIDGRVGTTWRDHYLMTDSYGINYQLDGAPVKVSNYFTSNAPVWATRGPSGAELPLFPVSANVYIEPVIHPLGTDCQNCHRRAGYPDKACDSAYSAGCGRTSYQTAQCADLLGDYGAPEHDLCMTAPWAWHGTGGDDCQESGGTRCDGKQAYPVLATDLIWIIPDLHVRKR